MSPIILVVEDHDELREEVALVLEAESYKVYNAADGRKAIEMLQKGGWRPDLIVSDIAMPHMDGYEFFTAVHSDTVLRAIPFIFLTARGTRHDERVGRQLGVDDYLVKPFDPEDLLIAIQNKLKRVEEFRLNAISELDEARRTMVQLLSHELRTPLTYVTGGFSLLAEELDNTLTPDAAISLDLIRSGANRLNRLTEQMVLFAELTSGHVQLQMNNIATTVSIESVLKNVVAIQSSDAAARNITLNLIHLSNEGLHVFGLGALLTSALLEVIRNAIAYSPEGSSIQIGLGHDANMAVIQITDSGRGIVPEDLPLVWNVLIQSERHKHEQQGAGMGLPIARKIIELHHGTIVLDSVVNMGTTATICLPLC